MIPAHSNFQINQELPKVKRNILPDFTQIINTILLKEIFSYLNGDDLCRCLIVNKRWNRIANDDELWIKLLPKMVFGEDQWTHFFGKVEKTEILPLRIYKILHRTCPFWPEKKIHETHFLA